MDSLRTLMDRKEFELVIKITETAKDAQDLFYRIAAFLALGKPEESLECIRVNGRLLEKEDLRMLIEMHIEILCLLGKFDDAYMALEHYESLPYESQVVEEQLQKYKKFIREKERESYKTSVMSQEDLMKQLDSNDPQVLINAIHEIREFNVEPFLNKLEDIMLNNKSQTIRSFALLLLVERKVNKKFRFNHKGTPIEVNPSELVPPFVDAKFQNFIRLIHSDFKNPVLSNSAQSIYSGYLIYIYPDTSEELDETTLLCALYGLCLEYLQTGDEMSLYEKCDLKSRNILEVQELMDKIRESIENI